jgi:hypothetical protein
MPISKEYIQSCLCSYDRRNPNFDEEIESFREEHGTTRQDERCYCDNCFYGRDELAREILRLMSIIEPNNQNETGSWHQD